jgi:hypothetical protein
MTVILETADGETMQINWFGWRPTVALLVRGGILPDGERAERCLNNGCGGILTSEEAEHAADFIATVISKMAANQRMLLDGETTNKPKDNSLPISQWDDEEAWNHYSTSVQLLSRFASFCRGSGGFTVH